MTFRQGGTYNISREHEIFLSKTFDYTVFGDKAYIYLYSVGLTITQAKGKTSDNTKSGVELSIRAKSDNYFGKQFNNSKIKNFPYP